MEIKTVIPLKIKSFVGVFKGQGTLPQLKKFSGKMASGRGAFRHGAYGFFIIENSEPFLICDMEADKLGISFVVRKPDNTLTERHSLEYGYSEGETRALTGFVGTSQFLVEFKVTTEEPANSQMLVDHY